MTPIKRQSSPQAVKKRSYQEKRDSTEEAGRASEPASDPGSSGDRGESGDRGASGGTAASGESNNEEPQAQQQSSEPVHAQKNEAEPQVRPMPSRTSSGAQTPTLLKKRKALSAPSKPGRGTKLPRPEAVPNCPRCCSFDTKFCYYNNYNVKQPRYFCKACQRYWTAGGTLRNVPVGAGRRKHKNAAARMQARLPPQSSAQTHVSPSTLDSFRVAELLQHQHGLPAALQPTLHHHGLMPAVGVGLALPHLAPTTLAGPVFVPETALPAHGLSSQQISRPGSSLCRSSDTLQQRLTTSNLNSKSVPSKPNGNGNGNNSSSGRSSGVEKPSAEEGSVHNRRYTGNRTTMRNKGSGEHGTNGETSGPQEPHSQFKSNGGGSASDPARATTASPSPPAAPSNGTLSHDSGTLLQGTYPSFAFPGQQHCDPGYGGRDAASTAWHLGLPHQHQHLASLANLQAQATMAATLGGPSPYGLAAPWPAYSMYPHATFGNQQYAAAMYARCAGLPAGQIPLPFQPPPSSSSSALPAGLGSDFPFHSSSVSALLPQLSHQRDGSAAPRPFTLPGAWAQTRSTWPLDLLQPSGILPVLPRSDRASMSNGSWPVDGGHGVVPPASMTQPPIVPAGIGVGVGKDGTSLLANGHTNGGQLFPAWPAAAGMPFNAWSQEPATASTWQQNWGQLPTTSGAGAAPYISLIPQTIPGNSSLSSSS